MSRPAPDGATWDDILFLDTETTGLSGGTGTLAFLIGVAWWESGVLHGRLDFLPSPGHEGALLANLAALASRFRIVVTYNGNGFDLPLLRTRGVLHRRRGLLDDLVSWDLLPAARRLWGRRLPNVRQPTVEQLIAGIVRDGQDIPGAQIPAAWIEFVRNGPSDMLALVLDHNRWDVEGMAGILNHVADGAERLARGPDVASAELAWQDTWSLARFCEHHHRREESWRWAALAIGKAPLGVSERRHGLGPAEPFFVDGVRLLKRSGDWQGVGNLLETALDHHPSSCRLRREAAILYEHRLPDLKRAIGHALQAEDPHRLARLERKLEE